MSPFLHPPSAPFLPSALFTTCNVVCMRIVYDPCFARNGSLRERGSGEPASKILPMWSLVLADTQEQQRGSLRRSFEIHSRAANKITTIVSPAKITPVAMRALKHEVHERIPIASEKGLYYFRPNPSAWRTSQQRQSHEPECSTHVQKHPPKTRLTL